jgi:GntR family transcriptional regulator, rspAB operon transcriptional repressor
VADTAPSNYPNRHAVDRPDKKSLSTMIADQMAEMIQTGVLRPSTHLVQNEWAETFNVSRIAIRDALAHLTQRGLVENIPQKGIVVKPLTVKEIHDIFEARRCVEAQAARNACERVDEDGMAEIEAFLEVQRRFLAEGAVDSFLENDVRFHMTIYRMSGNDVLFEIIERLWFRARQARNLIQIDPKVAQEGIHLSLERHERIVAALRNRDCDEFVRRVTNAIDRSEQELVKIVREYCAGGC